MSNTFSESTELRTREFQGKILPDVDPKRQRRYKVYIPLLMPHIDETDGIWCKNHVSGHSMTLSDHGTYGSKMPLHPGTWVMVRFMDNDSNTGYISRIISDHKEDTDYFGQDQNKPSDTAADRDEQYVLLKTPKKGNVIYINEESSVEKNSMFIIYNRDGDSKRRDVIRINEEGIHIWGRDNFRMRIKLNHEIEVDGDIKIHSKGTIHIKGENGVYIDGLTVKINEGAAEAVEVKDLETSEGATENYKKDPDNSTMVKV